MLLLRSDNLFYANGFCYCHVCNTLKQIDPLTIIIIITNSDIDYLDTWRAMEKLVDLGLVKSIGLSNFNSEQVDRVVNEGRIKPVSNQIECSAIINQKKLTAFCKEREVVIVAYCPLARHQLDNRPDIRAIAAKYNKTPAQIALRYLVRAR